MPLESYFHSVCEKGEYREIVPKKATPMVSASRRSMTIADDIDHFMELSRAWRQSQISNAGGSLFEPSISHIEFETAMTPFETRASETTQFRLSAITPMVSSPSAGIDFNILSSKASPPDEIIVDLSDDEDDSYEKRIPRHSLKM